MEVDRKLKGLLTIFVFLLSFFVSIVSQEAIGEKKAINGEAFTNPFSMKFIYITPGTFTDDERGYQVTVTEGFYIHTTEVTQGQWEAVMGNNPSVFKTCGDDCPVENVSWNDVQAFIQRLNQMEGTDKYRLPSEAEWEYACRAGSTTSFYYGNDEAMLGEYAWYDKNCREQTHPVGRKKPNAWGLYDMHGNVWEWCQDWEREDYTSGHSVNTERPSSGSNRVLHGGGWGSLAERCRALYHFSLPPFGRHGSVGFRLARTP